MRLSDSWPMSGRIRSTMHAWAWPFIVAAFANTKTGFLADADIDDRFLFDIAQIDPEVGVKVDEDDLDNCGIADCFVSAGLLRRVDGGYRLVEGR